jgi:hypothetical protein
VATTAKQKLRELTVEAPPGSWTWLKEYTGYAVTILPYVSAGLVLIQGLSVWVKAAILFCFAVIVLLIRVLHEKAGIEVTDGAKRQKKP